LQTDIQSADLALLATDPRDDVVAAELAERLGLPLLPTGSDPASCDEVDAVLVVNGGCLSLQQTGRGAPGPVTVDFGSSAMRHRRRSGHNELLGRSVGVGKKSPLWVVDATAGLGRDSFVLADLGCEVTLCEREPVIEFLELARKARLDVQALEIGPVAISRLIGAISAEQGAKNVLVINSGRRARHRTRSPRPSRSGRRRPPT